MTDDKVLRLVPPADPDAMIMAPDAVLRDAMGRYVNVVVIGECEDGTIEVEGSDNVAQANLLMDRGKRGLLDSV